MRFCNVQKCSMRSHKNPQGSTIFHKVPSVSMRFHRVYGALRLRFLQVLHGSVRISKVLQGSLEFFQGSRSSSKVLYDFLDLRRFSAVVYGSQRFSLVHSG